MATGVRNDGLEPDGAWAQSAELSFRFLFIVVFLLAIGWAVSNCRQVPADSRAIVLRFGNVVREVGAGLLVALPRPFEQVVILPSADRQIEFKIDSFTGAGVTVTDLNGAPYGSAQEPAFLLAPVSTDPRQNAGLLLTGDMSVVHFRATLFYQITNANAYILSSEHITPALARLFAASAVAVSANRDLDTILVARPELNASGEAARAGRESLRADLMTEVNRRLADLASQGPSLGINVSRVDLVPSIPDDAKAAFDSVLEVLQEAETVTAQARTQAETTTQKANQDRDRILTDAQALAEEKVTEAKTRTAVITALSDGLQGTSGDMLSTRIFQDRIGGLLGQAGKVFTTDGADGARFILSGGRQQ